MDNAVMCIGVKLIKAVPMTRLEYNEYRGWTLPADEDGTDEGFLVEYVDGGQGNHPDHEGYISWSPKEVFERAYFPLEDGTKITEGDVRRMMGPVVGEQISPKSTLVKAEHSLIGFDTYNVSSCVSPENYDTDTGVKFGSEPIVSEFWKCLGFVLQWARNGLKPNPVSETSIPAYQQRVLDEYNELRNRVEKLGAFVVSDKFNEVDPAERNRLYSQNETMKTYLEILEERIAGFGIQI